MATTRNDMDPRITIECESGDVLTVDMWYGEDVRADHVDINSDHYGDTCVSIDDLLALADALTQMAEHAALAVR